MANAAKDQNFVPTMIAISTADGTTILPIYINASTHGIKIDDASTGSRTGNHALKDANGISTLCALSSAGDGAIVPLYVNNSTNGILIDSN